MANRRRAKPSYFLSVPDARLSRYLRPRPKKTDIGDARGLAELRNYGLPSVRLIHLKTADTQRLRSKLEAGTG